MNLLLVSTCKERLHNREFVDPFDAYLQQKNMQTKKVHAFLQASDDKLLNNTHIDWADKIILCGTGLADNDYLEHMEKFAWVESCSKPIIGICSGIQIIAAVFRGSVIKQQEIGMVAVKGDLFEKKEFEAYTLHQNGIAHLEEFHILAKSDTSTQAIKHKTKDIFGVTFHPEVRNMWVIDNFLW